jgi:phosphatidylglycerophosphate synthase
MRFFSVALIIFRALMGPYLLFEASDGQISQWFLWAFAGGVISDILDGEILRRFKLSNTKLRSLDSTTDAVFYMSVLVSMWLVHPNSIRMHIIPLTFLLLTQTTSWVFCLLRFGKTTSYHSYIAKFWGLSLFVGTIGFFLSPPNIILFLFAIYVGIISNIEDMVITAIMPYWKCDILSIKSAMLLRL